VTDQRPRDGDGRHLRVGVLILPEHRWLTAQELWRRAEDLGFDHAWTYDHLSWRSLRDSAWFGAIPTLTAAALATERIRLGPMVASPTFRHPVPFVKELVALDDISGGRLTVGIGAGADGWDTTVLGEPPWSRRERAERFAEFVAITDLLLREPVASYEGHFYRAAEARNWPGCVQQPRVPLAVAASGPRGMRVAATHGDAWVTTGDRTRRGPIGAAEGARIVREQLDRLETICVEVGRDPASIDRIVVTGPILDPGLQSPDAFGETAGRYAEVGVTDLIVHWPRPDGAYAGDLATFERIFSA